MKKVQTTAIEKKYKDKKTGEYKSLTINHAKVKDRLKAFWEDNPNGKIETKPTLGDKKVMFSCTAITNQKDEFSKTATAHSFGEYADEKSFEKQETIAVGRALALLGYSTDGEIASSEEMEEFYEFKQQQHEEKIAELSEQIGATKNIDELKKLWVTIGGVMQKELEPIKEAKKKQFNEN